MDPGGFADCFRFHLFAGHFFVCFWEGGFEAEEVVPGAVTARAQAAKTGKGKKMIGKKMAGKEIGSHERESLDRGGDRFQGNLLTVFDFIFLPAIFSSASGGGGFEAEEVVPGAVTARAQAAKTGKGKKMAGKKIGSQGKESPGSWRPLDPGGFVDRFRFHLFASHFFACFWEGGFEAEEVVPGAVTARAQAAKAQKRQKDGWQKNREPREGEPWSEAAFDFWVIC